MYYSASIFIILAHLISICGPQKSNVKCGLHGERLSMTFDNGPAEVFVTTGNNETCIVGVRMELPFYSAKISCEKLFPGGTMMSDENLHGLRSKLKEANFTDMRGAVYYAMKNNSCLMIIKETFATQPCNSLKFPSNYFCQYPMQHNCAWEYHYVEIVTKSDVTEYYGNGTIYNHANELGPEKNCMFMQQRHYQSFQCDAKTMFAAGHGKWSACSATCSDATLQPPIQSIKRSLNLDCIDQTKNAKQAFLHSVRTCNGHVTCLPVYAVSPAAMSADIAVIMGVSIPLVFAVVFVIVIIVVVWLCLRKRANLKKVRGGSVAHKQVAKSTDSKVEQKSAKSKMDKTPQPTVSQPKSVRNLGESKKSTIKQL